MSRRAVVALIAVCVALVVQTSVLPHLAWHDVTADLVLVVVVVAATTAGPQFGMLLGFAAGLLLDLAPPADHVAGRWALALLVVGYVAGRVRPQPDADLLRAGSGGDEADRPRVLQVLATVAACSFLGSSVFALTGLVLQDRPLSVPELLQVVLLGVLWDVALTPLVAPGLLRLMAPSAPERVCA